MISTPTKNPNYFVSSKGFSLEIVMPHNFIYREEGREIDIYVEPLTGSIPFAVYRESIPKEEQERILENIREVFRYQGYDIDVE